MKPIGIVPTLRKDHQIDQNCHWEIDISENTVDMELVVPSLVKSLHKYNVMMILKLMGLTRLKNSTFQFEEFHAITDWRPCSSNLRQTLYDYGLRFQAVPGDGNCFFTSIALNLLSDMTIWHPSLSLAGISSSTITVETY